MALLKLSLLILTGSCVLGAGGGFQLDVRKGTYSFGDVSGFGAAITGARFGLDVNSTTLWSTGGPEVKWDGPSDGSVAGAKGNTLDLRFPEAGVRWTIRIRRTEDGAAILSSTIKNENSEAIRLGRCRLADVTQAGARLRTGAADENATGLFLSGWQGPSQVKRLRDLAHPLVSKTLFQLYNSPARAAFQAGFVTFDRVNTAHEVYWDPKSASLKASSYCDFEGFRLGAGASVDSEELALRNGDDPYANLREWAETVHSHYRPRIWPKIPAGWVGWSWVDPFNIERYEDVVFRNAKAIRERLPGLDIEYIWVSIGNLVDREPGGWLRWNTALFPSGPKAVVEHLAGLNFRLGLWAGAFWLSSRLSADVERLREALLLRGGKPLEVPHRDLGAMYVLDPTHPLTGQHLREVFRTYRDWGVRYFMIDFLDAVAGSTPGRYLPDRYHDATLVPGPQTLRAGLRVIREAAGPDTYLLASTGPTIQTTGLVDGCRVGTDYGEGRPLDGPGKGFYPGTFVINRPDYWTSHRRATDALATHFFMHRKLFIADSGNVLTIDKPVPLSDAQISATLFGINGGPIMLGDDIARMAQDRLEMVKQLFPRLPECATPLDLFESPDPDYPKLFHLKIRADWDQWDLLAAFNFRNEPLVHKLDFGRLGFSSQPARLVWDFWNERYLGAHAEAFHFVVPPQSVRLFRISEARKHPWLLSTDMHIRQGQAEVPQCLWEPETRTLTISAARPAGGKGNVFIHVPKGLAVENPTGLWIAKDGNDGSLIVRCELNFAKAPEVRKSIRFKPLPAN